MNMWLAIVSIVAIVLFADTIQKISKNRAKKKANNPDLEDSLAQIEMLEERIRVLERIVTENKFDLRSEINKL